MREFAARAGRSPGVLAVLAVLVASSVVTWQHWPVVTTSGGPVLCAEVPPSGRDDPAVRGACENSAGVFDESRVWGTIPTRTEWNLPGWEDALTFALTALVVYALLVGLILSVRAIRAG